MLRARWRGQTAWSNGVWATLAGPDADHLVDGCDEDLAVADAPGMRGLLDGLHGALDHRILQHDLDLHLGEEVHDIFRAPVELGMALLPAEALRLRHGDALDAHLMEGVLHFVELERLDDRFDFLHGALPRLDPASVKASGVPNDACTG